MAFTRALALAALASEVNAQRGWHLIAQDIGGSPLGVAFFEDGVTGVTETSQLLPAGYETKRSSDGGVTWATVPDKVSQFVLCQFVLSPHGPRDVWPMPLRKAALAFNTSHLPPHSRTSLSLRFSTSRWRALRRSCLP